MAHFNVAPEKLVMIGDRYSTDVLFGNLHGTYDTATIPPTHPCKHNHERKRTYVLTRVLLLYIANGALVCTYVRRAAYDPHGPVYAQRRERRERAAAAHREGSDPAASARRCDAARAPAR